MFAVCIANPSFAANISNKLVKAYHKEERSRTLLSHHDAILAGRTGTTTENGFFVEEFDPSTHELNSSIKLRHSIRGLQSMDECNVLAYGTSDYSVIDYCNKSAPASQTYAIGGGIVAHAGAYVGNDSFLFYEPNAGIVRLRLGGTPRKVAPKISMTLSISFVAEKAWFANYSNLWMVDPNTGSKRAVFDKKNNFYGIRDSIGFRNSKGKEMLAATSRESGKLLIVDASSGKMVEQLDLGKEPEGISQIGSCLAVSDSLEKQIYFVNLDEPNNKIIAKWDATAAGDKLKSPSKIAVDIATGQIFLRSSYPCPLCSVTQSSIYAFETDDLEQIADCL